jgi:cell wall-active antibiotic response 4TMS protein YvqF
MALATPPSPSTSMSPTGQSEMPGLPPPSRPRPRGLVGGLVLIAVGILFLIQQLAAPNWGWDIFWPVLLIVIGVAVGASPLVYGQPLHYARTFWAVALVSVGALFLIGNLGYLNGWDMDRLGQLWPLILVLIGAEILITRSLPRQTAAAVGAVVALLTVVGAAFYVGLGPSTSLGTTSSTASAAIGNLEQASLDLNVGGATVTIDTNAVPGQLYSARFHYDNGDRTVASLNRSTGELRLELQNRSLFFFGSGGGRAIDLSLSDQVPWSVTINGGATQQTIDFSGLQLSRLSINGGAQQITLILPAASGVVPIELNGGAANLIIHRPAGTEASLTMSGGVNDLTADGQHQTSLAGDLSWQSSGYSGSINQYNIRVSGGANHVTIDTR